MSTAPEGTACRSPQPWSFLPGSEPNSHADDERTPLIGPGTNEGLPTGRKYTQSAEEEVEIEEAGPSHCQQQEQEQQQDRSVDEGKRTFRYFIRNAIYLACSLLVFVAIVLLLLRSVAPFTAKKYAQKAVLLEVGDVSVESLTDTGVNVRLRGEINVESSRVESTAARLVGKLATGLLKTVRISSSSLDVYLPDYSMGHLGSASYPDFIVDIQDGHSTTVDLISNVQHGSLAVVKKLIDDFFNGNIGSLVIDGRSEVNLKAGIFPIGKHKISQIISLDQFPSIPSINITQLELGESNDPNKPGIMANASLFIANNYPLRFNMPAIAFDIFLPDCSSQLVRFTTATIPGIDIEPHSPIVLIVNGKISSIPDSLTCICPESGRSPIDNIVSAYMQGKENTVYIRGSSTNDKLLDIPRWISDFLKNLNIPLPVPGGHKYDDILKSFTLTDVDFSLPSHKAPPGSPDSYPRLSANIAATIGLPPEINFSLNVSKIKADTSLLFHGKKFAELHTQQLVPATSTYNEEGLQISAKFSDVPLNVTNMDVFSEVVRKVVLGNEKGVELEIKGTADAMMEAAKLRAFVVRGIPAQGKVYIERGSSLDKLHPHVTGLRVISSSRSSFTFTSNITFNNPTNYSATVPYVNFLLLNEGVILGNITARNDRLSIGKSWTLVETIWSPFGDPNNVSDAGSRFLGDYVSGKNVSVTLKVHENSIPALPDLCKALQHLEMTVPAPPLSSEDDDGEGSDKPDHSGENSHVIKSATLHILSSTGSFVLNNPLLNTSIYLSRLTGWATHNGTILGTINYTYPIKIPPGISETPKLPVEWSIGGVGYDIVRKALGGVLKVDANAECDVQMASYECRLKIQSSGIGAHVAL